MDLPILIVLWLLQGSIAAYGAKRTGRNPYLWFALGCFFGIFAILAVFFIKKRVQKVGPTIPVTTETPTRKTLPSRLWYYLDQNTQQKGPIQTFALEHAWEEGQILPSTYVWHEGMENWKTWQEVCEENGIVLNKPVEIPTAT